IDQGGDAWEVEERERFLVQQSERRLAEGFKIVAALRVLERRVGDLLQPDLRRMREIALLRRRAPQRHADHEKDERPERACPAPPAEAKANRSEHLPSPLSAVARMPAA